MIFSCESFYVLHNLTIVSSNFGLPLPLSDTSFGSSQFPFVPWPSIADKLFTVQREGSLESGGQTSLTQNLLPEDSKGPIQLGYVGCMLAPVSRYLYLSSIRKFHILYIQLYYAYEQLSLTVK